MGFYLLPQLAAMSQPQTSSTSSGGGGGGSHQDLRHALANGAYGASCLALVRLGSSINGSGSGSGGGGGGGCDNSSSGSSSSKH